MFRKYSKTELKIKKFVVELHELRGTDDTIIVKAVVNGIGGGSHVLRELLSRCLRSEWDFDLDILLGDIDRADEISVSKYENQILPTLFKLADKINAA